MRLVIDHCLEENEIEIPIFLRFVLTLDGSRGFAAIGGCFHHATTGGKFQGKALTAGEIAPSDFCVLINVFGWSKFID